MEKAEDIRRKKPRFKVKMDGFYFYNGHWENCVVFDMNLEGAGLLVNQDMELNSVIKIKLINKSEEAVIESIIVNKNKFKIGIKYVNPDNEAYKAIKNSINSFSNRFTI